MDPLVLRVTARFQEREGAIGDPKTLLQEFEAGIKSVTQPAGKVAEAKANLEAYDQLAASSSREEWYAYRQNLSQADKTKEKEAQQIAYDCLFAVKHGSSRVVDPGHKLFLSLLQTYTLPPALRKKVEIAARAYLKKTAPRTPKSKGKSSAYLEYILYYEKFLTTLHAHLAVAKDALAKGKEHSAEGTGATKMKVGPFTLINTGGFPEKQMNEVADVVQKVSAYAQTSGLGKVCYGEIQITNSIHGKGNVLAFYLIAQDELFIRANVKATTDSVQTVLHELGHRYERQFLKDDRGVASLYRTLEGQERTRKWDKTKSKHPEPGDTLVNKGKTYVVQRTVPQAGFKGYKVELTYEKEGRPQAASIALDAFWEMKGQKARNFDEEPEYIGFVTDYAKAGGASENFAEMFSYYCMGRLPVKQSGPFEALVFGTEKTANERMALRVAARFRLTGP